jgi:hypothetical protein
MRTRPALQSIAFLFGPSLTICALLLLAGCGGSGSSPSSVATTTPPPSATIKSVSVSCTLNTVPVEKTSQCTPKVQGTGSFSSAVTWSVNGVQGGNSTTGTVSSSGLYTAPATVPTPYTVDVTATSNQDGTKSAFASVVVAGTIASTTQTVTAAAGGTITLPDGSSVTIPANVLSADQAVTVSKLSAPQNPQSGSVVNAGPLLNLSLSVPMPQVKMPPRSRNPRNQSSQPDASDIQFSIMIGSDANSTLQGSAPMVDLVTSSGEENILFPSGSYDQGTQVAQVNIDPSYLSGVQQMYATMANFDSTIPIAPAPSWELYWVAGQGFQRLPPSAPGSCPLLSSFQNANILILVHGMFSSVEGAFANSAGAIETAGGYTLILGFDYDWTQRVPDSGKELADFINSLASCQGIQRIDIEAHSEGVAVTLSAPGLPQTPNTKGTQINPQAISLIRNVVSLAGPIRGTPLADDPAAFVECYELQHPLLLWIPPVLAADFAGAVGDIPPFQDLTSTGDPLSQFRQSFAQTLPGIEFTAVGGDSPYCGPILNPILELLVFNDHPFDGVVPLDSALGFNSGIPQLHPLPPFPDDHSSLHDDQNVINDVGKQVLQGIPPLATLSCQGSETTCDATQAQAFSFLFTESGRSLDSSYLDIFMQDSSGNVTPLSPAFSYADGGISWSLMPSCSNTPCDFSIFALDTADTLASNDVMATVESGNGTAGVSFSPTNLNFGNLQTGTSATQPVTLTNTGTATLQITQIDLTNNAGAFSLNNPCPTSLAVGANCTVSVTFTPTQAGAQTATLSVTDNAAGSPQGVPLSGTGTSSVSQLSTFTISPNTISSGQSATLSLGLSGTTNSTATISLISDNPSAFPVPPTVNIQAGQSSTSFSAQAGTVTSATTVTVTATYNGVSLQAQVTVTPTVQAPVLTTFTISPSTISSGQSATLFLGLSGTTSSTATIALSSNNPSAFPVPSTVNIQAGQSSTSFSDEAGTVTSATTVTVTATYNGVSLQAQVTVTPVVQAPVLTTFTISPNTISSGQFATLFLGLNGTTSSTATIALSSNNPSAFPVPSTVNIQAGQSSTSFSDEAGTVTSATTVTVTATYNGVSLQAQVTVNPTTQIPVLTTFTISPNTISSGQFATLFLGLSGMTSSTATIALSSNNPSAFPVPSTVNIHAGQSSTSFSDEAGTVASAATVTVTATYNGISLQAQVTVNPITPTITSISPNPVPIGPAETILISGTNFQTGGTLHFTWTVDGGGSDNRTDYTFIDSGDLLITINTGTVASTGWTVQMTNSSGPPSNVFPFSVQ